VHGVEPPLHPSDEVPVAMATLPPVADMLMGVGSIRSGEGSGEPFAPPACWTSRYRPGARAPPGSSVICVDVAPKFPAPVALAYWSERPVRSTRLVPRLKISM
jgi:hypothetical protein